MARRSLLLCLVALALLVSGCSIDTTVTVTVKDDGSGTVSVNVAADGESVQAAEAGGGRLEERVRLSDLPAAGWTVSPWVRNPDGSATLHIEKPFTSVDQIPGILEELSGSYGPLRDATFTRERSFFSTKYTARAAVDLGAIGTGISDDADLVAKLQAQGVDVAGVDQQLLGQLQNAFHATLVVELPDGTKVTASPEPGKSATIDASASVRDTRRTVLVGIAIGLAVLALVVAVWPRCRRRRRGRRPHGVAGRA